jgi:hypothetical protein
LWQRALFVAVEAAQATSTQAEVQLSRLNSQLALRARTFSQREVELDGLLRARERTVKELEEHLRAALSMLTKRDVTNTALESRLLAAQQETEDYRRRLAALVQRAVVRHRRAPTKLKRRAQSSSRSILKKLKRKRSR